MRAAERRNWKALIAVLAALAIALVPCSGVLAATTADIVVTATPQYIAVEMAVGNDTYDFGLVAESATPSTAEDYFNVVNSSTVVTDNTISVTTSTWSGGVTWTHSDTATPGEDTAGLLANQDGTWGVGDVIVKNSDPNILADDQAATTNWAFGLKLYAPTAFTDGVEKEITVRVTAAAAS